MAYMQERLETVEKELSKLNGLVGPAGVDGKDGRDGVDGSLHERSDLTIAGGDAATVGCVA